MFTFNGVHANTHGLKVVTVDRSPLPAIENTLLEVPYTNGAYFVKNRLKPRTIDIDVKVIGTSEADLRTKVRNIGAWLYSKQPAVLKFDDETDRQYLAVVDATSLQEVLLLGEGNLRFLCPQPYAEATNPTYTALVAGANTVTVGGNTEVPPTLHLNVGATLSSIVITDYLAKTVLDDFVGKVTASNAENPHKAMYYYGTALRTPALFVNDAPQFGHDRIATQNGVVWTATNTTNLYISQELFSFDLIGIVERKLGITIPAQDTAGKVTWLKANLSKLTFKWYGYGSGPLGNKATIQRWSAVGSAWSTDTTTNHTNATVTGITQATTTPSNQIDANGFAHLIAYAEPANGTIASEINTDYVSIEVEFMEGRNVLTLTGSFASGDKIVIDCKRGLVTHNGTNALPKMDLASEFTELKVGANTLVLPTNVTGTLTHKNRWL